jgi:hypothetical protein
MHHRLSNTKTIQNFEKRKNLKNINKNLLPLNLRKLMEVLGRRIENGEEK